MEHATFDELKLFAANMRIPHRSEAKTKKDLIKLLTTIGYDDDDFNSQEDTLDIVQFVTDDQSDNDIDDYEETLQLLIKREFGDLPFDFSGSYLLERLDASFGTSKIVLTDQRAKNGPKLTIQTPDGSYLTPRDVIMVMRDSQHYQMMTELAGDYQFLADFRKHRGNTYEAIFDS